MTQKMEIEVLPYHLALVLPFLSFLVKGGPHVHEKPIDPFLCRRQSGYPKQQDPSQKLPHILANQRNSSHQTSRRHVLSCQR